MNVVGKVGSFISQGVYSVATPFHPFGGAVDIIVVQQQDGTFRSTPWYVRFGKFQGVLKGAEKIVRISVNGVEADFHMYLDNSGEAYFIREVDPNKEDEDKADEFSKESNSSGTPVQNESNNEERHNHYVDNFRLEHTVSDSGAMQLSVSSAVGCLERAESDGDRRFYDFQDERPSQDDPISLSEYGSNRYENESFSQSQDSNSEVVLVSVDGHILTAPLSASEKNAENVQLDTPQFHLGPGEGAEFCEGSEDFASGENTWAADYIGELKVSTADDVSHNLDAMNDEPKDSSNDLRVCEGDGEHVCQEELTQIVLEQEVAINVQSDSPDTLERYKQEEVFKSCLELPDLATQDGNVDSDDVVSPSDILSEEKLAAQDVNVDSDYTGPPSDIQTKEKSAAQDVNVYSDYTVPPSDIQTKEKSAAQEVNVDSDSVVSPSDIQSKEKSAVQDMTMDSDCIVSPSNEELSGSLPAVDVIESGQGVEIKSNEESHSFFDNGTCEDPDIRHDSDNKDNLETEQGGSISKSDRCYSFPEPENEQLGTSEAVKTMENDNETRQSEDGHDENVTAEEQSAAVSEEVEAPSKSRFEISLCRHELRTGMGLAVAAEAFDAHRVSAEEFLNSMKSIVTSENLVVRYAERYLTWEKAAPIILGASVFGLDLPVESIDTIPIEQEETVKSVENDAGGTPTSGSRRWRLWPIPFRRVKTIQHENTTSSSEDVFVDSESSSQHSHNGPAVRPQHEQSPHKLVRTNVPTSEQIASLNLQDGQNVVTFSFLTRVLGEQQVDAHIYLWKWNARIVISDVDGTITKSDVLGQFMPLVGKDWTQSGVARLFSAIKENGYQLLFLSARAIVQAYLTRSFLLNLKQDGKALPSGPVVISPDGLFPSFFREVIRRAPHEFKIACLQDIRALFPSDYNPFYAGFGNRDTDELSYRKIGIPKGKIFIINPKGEVAISHRIDVRSYTSLHTLANDMFPPTSLIEQEDYNSWNYWRTPLPEIEDNI